MTPTGPGSSSTAGQSRRLAAFAAWPAVAGGQPVPAATAIVYLPLHRTRPVTVTEQTLAFGFRAASAADPAEVPGRGRGRRPGPDAGPPPRRRPGRAPPGRRPGRAPAGRRRGGATAGWQRWQATGPTAARRPAGPPCSTASSTCPAACRSDRACQQAGISPMHGRRHRADRSWHQADAGGGAGAGDRAAVRPAPGPLRMGRDTATPGTVMAASAWDCLPWPAYARRPLPGRSTAARRRLTGGGTA